MDTVQREYVFINDEGRDLPLSNYLKGETKYKSEYFING